MSQNQLCTTVRVQPVFPINIRSANPLFSGFCEGDFAVIHGSTSILSLTSLLCVRAQLPTQFGGLQSSVVFIDGGNTFRLYQIAQLAQIHHLKPKEVLDNVFISRAFTAYQITTLIMQKLRTTINKTGAKLVILSDLAGFFTDKDLPDDEAQQVFRQVTTYLSKFAKENHIILITTHLPHKNDKRNNYLQTLACAKANVVLSLKQTPFSGEISLEKHPYLKLGSVELPSGITTLEDFVGVSA
jgi:hypothetical protein